MQARIVVEAETYKEKTNQEKKKMAPFGGRLRAPPAVSLGQTRVTARNDPTTEADVAI